MFFLSDFWLVPKCVLDLKMVGPLKVGFQQNNKKIGEGHLQDMAPELVRDMEIKKKIKNPVHTS